MEAVADTEAAPTFRFPRSQEAEVVEAATAAVVEADMPLLRMVVTEGAEKEAEISIMVSA